jgi:hypothetical protein
LTAARADGAAMNHDELVDAIGTFLAQIDRNTGYLR